MTLINDEARRLVPLDGDPIGRSIEDFVSHPRLASRLSRTVAGDDSVVVTDDHILMVDRMPVSRDGRDLGAVVTLRDRTEFEGLLRELDRVDALTDALHVQPHEFSNRMHGTCSTSPGRPRDVPKRSGNESRRPSWPRCFWPRQPLRRSAASSLSPISTRTVC